MCNGATGGLRAPQQCQKVKADILSNHILTKGHYLLTHKRSLLTHSQTRSPVHNGQKLTQFSF